MYILNLKYELTSKVLSPLIEKFLIKNPPWVEDINGNQVIKLRSQFRRVQFPIPQWNETELRLKEVDMIPTALIDEFYEYLDHTGLNNPDTTTTESFMQQRHLLPRRLPVPQIFPTMRMRIIYGVLVFTVIYLTLHRK